MAGRMWNHKPLRRSLADDDLPTAPGPHDATRLMHGECNVVAVVGRGESCVHTDPNRDGSVDRHGSLARALWAPAQAVTAAVVSVNATKNESPSVLISQPPCAAHCSRNSAS